MDPVETMQDTTLWEIVWAVSLPVGGGLVAVAAILLARRRWGDKSGKSEPFRF
jgi:hypothetical protein